MVLPGHLAGGYLATASLLSLTGWTFSVNELNALYIIGTIAGEIPDIDLFAFYFENKFKTQMNMSFPSPIKVEDKLQWKSTMLRLLSVFNMDSRLRGNDREDNNTFPTHREYFTHIPLFWIISSLIISFLGLLFSSPFTIATGFVILVGTMSHFILDSIDYGITWLKPFSQKRFSIFPMEPIEKHSPHEIVGSLSYYWNYLKSTYLKQLTFYAEFLITAVALYFLLK